MKRASPCIEVDKALTAVVTNSVVAACLVLLLPSGCVVKKASPCIEVDKALMAAVTNSVVAACRVLLLAAAVCVVKKLLLVQLFTSVRMFEMAVLTNLVFAANKEFSVAI